MEFGHVHVKELKINDLLNAYGDTIPKEFFLLNEEDAVNSVRNEFFQLTNSAAIYSQLTQDCSLDSLCFPGEHNTLEEVVQVIPDRPPDLMPLKTLYHIPHCNLHSKSRTSLLSLLGRMASPLIDLSYNNTSDDSPESTEMLSDVLVTVGVFRPVSVSNVDLCAQSRYMVMSQRLALLGSQPLTKLKDAIRCPQDKVWLGDCSEALDDPNLHIAAEKLYKSSYFFIDGIFYDDLRDPQNKALSRSLIEWARTKDELDAKGPFTSKPMESVLMRDLIVHCGKPYFYVHQGNCEHVFMFLDVQLLDRTACQNPLAYPILTGRCYSHPLHCLACKRLAARWFASNAENLLPVDPCHLCDVCLRLLLYDEDGRKIDPKIQVHMLCGDEVVVL